MYEDDARYAVENGVRLLAEDDVDGSEAWLQRAKRLAPNDPVVAFLLASAVSTKRPLVALEILSELLRTHPHYRNAHVTRAAILYRLGRREACDAVNLILGTMVTPADHAFAALATQISEANGYCGWVGLARTGKLIGNASNLAALIDGKLSQKKVDIKSLPLGWTRQRRMEVKSNNGTILGGSFNVAAIMLIDGFVEAPIDGVIQGWVYAPGDPEANLIVEVRMEGQARPVAYVAAADSAGVIPGSDGLLQARHFRLSVPFPSTTIRIHVGIGHHTLRGSPICPWPLILAARCRPVTSVQSPGHLEFLPSALPSGSQIPPRAAVDVIVPLDQGDLDFTACYDSIVANLTPGVRVICIADGVLEEKLQTLTAEAEANGNIVLLRHPTSRGRSAAVNTGLSLSEGRDVLILNSNTILPFGVFTRLGNAAYSEAAIGTVTPLTTDGSRTTSIQPKKTECPLRSDDQHLWDDIAADCNARVRVDLSTCSNFCVFIRHDCMKDVGAFDENAFSQGYYEDTDFSLRAKQLGWRNVAACDVVVSHESDRSLSPADLALRARNLVTLARLHPGYDSKSEAAHDAGVLAPARLAIAKRAWSAGVRHDAVVLITHTAGGGVERFVRNRAEAIERSGGRAILVRPAEAGYAVSDRQYENPYLVFPTVSVLAEFLRSDSTSAVEIHHLVSHIAGLEQLGDILGIPTDIFIHDFAPICPQVTLCGRTGRYCGEPLDPQECTRCVEDIGTEFLLTTTVDRWRAGQTALFLKARRVVAFSPDTVRRIHRYMPKCAVHVEPPENDDNNRLKTTFPVSLGVGQPLRIAVVGALGVSKGYHVVLACARDAERRALPLRFTVVGHTIDDQRLLDTNFAFVTGRFEEGEACELLTQSGAQIGFLPSVWPETWCYALSELWRAKLPVIAFDLGSQAARIRATMGGRLLPIHTPATLINDFFLNLRKA